MVNRKYLICFSLILALSLWVSKVFSQEKPWAPLPNTCPENLCPADLSCKMAACVKCGITEDIFPPIAESSLQEYAANRGMWIGATIQTKGDLDYLELYKASVNRELNADQALLYMKAMWPEIASISAFRVDNLIKNWGEPYKLRLVGGPLVYSNNSSPDWLNFKQTGCGGWTKAQLEDLLKNYIQTLVNTAESGGNGIAVWSVVNEPLTNIGKVCWSKTLAEAEPLGTAAYIEKAFKWAKEANPEALLLLNETFLTEGVDRERVDAFINLLDQLQARQTPIDIIGIEMHLFADKLRPSYVDEFKYYLEQTKAKGVKVFITEMDVYQGPAGFFPDPWEVQKQIYKNIVATCLEYNHCAGLFTWGLSDRYPWTREDDVNPIPDTKPLLFDENLQRKPAYDGVMEAFQENLTRACTPCQKSADANGDGLVNLYDIRLWLSNYLNNLFFKETGEFICDQKLNLFDYGLWLMKK